MSTIDAGGVRAPVTDRLAAVEVPTVVDLRVYQLPSHAAGKAFTRQMGEELDRQIPRT